MPNIWPTLIAAPQVGYPTLGVRDRMKHYITGLDKYLLLTDEEVRRWEDKVLVAYGKNWTDEPKSASGSPRRRREAH